MSKALMAFGSFTVALSVGLATIFIGETTGMMVGFGTLTAILIDEVNNE